MNREDIIRMARETGCWETDTGELVTDEIQLGRFAALVASAEREVIAQMIEDAPKLMDFAQNDQGGCLMCGFTPKLAAKSVREKWGRHD